MDAAQMCQLMEKYGIGAVLVIFLCFISWSIMKKILNQSDNIYKMAVAMQEKWMAIISAMSEADKVFFTQVTEAHKYQRDEHIEQIKALTKISDAAEIRKQALDKILDNLKEQGQVLLRINGEKHG